MMKSLVIVVLFGAAANALFWPEKPNSKFCCFIPKALVLDVDFPRC